MEHSKEFSVISTLDQDNQSIVVEIFGYPKLCCDLCVAKYLNAWTEKQMTKFPVQDCPDKIQ
jgi:hypothetical protein